MKILFLQQRIGANCKNQKINWAFWTLRRRFTKDFLFLACYC